MAYAATLVAWLCCDPDRITSTPEAETLHFPVEDEPGGERLFEALRLCSPLVPPTDKEMQMALLNAVYMKLRAFIQFIERADEEFLAGEVDDHQAS